MSTMLVTGGTGHVGRALVARLAGEHEVRVLTRSPGTDTDIRWYRGDLASGRGVPEAVHGADVVIHAATHSPAAQRGFPLPRDARRSPPEVDVDATSQLLDLAAANGVRHFVQVSIVGVEEPWGAYPRLKHTAEELVRVGDVPWSIVRSTPFHWLIARMLDSAARLPLVPLPKSAPIQPADSDEFAAFAAAAVAKGPSGTAAEFGGPEVMDLATAVEQWQTARRRRLRVLGLPLPDRTRRRLQAMTCPEGTLGEVTWSDWLRE
ncbi:NAD(P)H-binding protein [Allosaccharopolyspora coralli]|uniref:NAD(P)H-binding protein n=1 Tax=Allosaccharopolyspora coralli TaxID=2665642 RepID=A0A5Q3Q703_9PSEU|nr:NAD(P)H-binding protein [Allosaccharopolyspora coralli]QGK70398.1 NAD(P)H-binding protein [Allosaccharopolyspora coralli]